MSDLTRRVLEAHAQNPDLEQDTPEMADAVYDLATAAPILARQVEAVEALADRLDREAEKGREKPNRTIHDHGWDDACTVAAFRTRIALSGDNA